MIKYCFMFVCRVEKVMESFNVSSAVQGHHVYRDVWEASVGEKLVARRELDNQFDKFAAKVLNGKETLGHILENSMVFSHSWWIDFCRGERTL